MPPIDQWAFSQDELEEYDELAGKFEFDAGMTRAEAERQALEDMHQRDRGDDSGESDE